MNVARSEVDVHPSQRNSRVTGQRPEEREIFERIIANGLVDVGRAVDPDNDRLFTWWPYWRSARERNLGWRLDYVLASAPLAARVRACRCSLPRNRNKRPRARDCLFRVQSRTRVARSIGQCPLSVTSSEPSADCRSSGRLAPSSRPLRSGPSRPRSRRSP